MPGDAAQGRVLSRQCWAIVASHRGLIAFPSTSLACCLGVGILLGTLAILSFSRSAILGLACVVVLIIVLVAIDTVSSAALVVATEQVLVEGRVGVSDAWRGALAALGPLVIWSWIRAGVGSALSVVRGDATQQSGGLLLRGVISAAGGVAWGIVTFFVVPVLVLERVRPMAAIRRSASLARDRWGSQLRGTVRIGALVGVTIVLPAIVLVLAGLALLADPGKAATWLGLPCLALGAIGVITGAIITGTLRGVFSVVLYRYATNGTGEGGFTATELQAAFGAGH